MVETGQCDQKILCEGRGGVSNTQTHTQRILGAAFSFNYAFWVLDLHDIFKAIQSKFE